VQVRAVDTDPGADPEGRSGIDSWVQAFERQISLRLPSGDDVVPAYPAVAARIQELVGQRADLAEIARAVGADSALAADVLRCANSAMYRRAQPAETLTQAVTHVGAHQVLRLALASGLAARALASGPLAPLRRRYWIDALAGAAVCQELAQLRHLPTSHAFLLGLLHDFGKIVVLRAVESSWRDAGARCAVPVEALDQLAERHHVPIGAALARSWRFPDLIQEVIAVHHNDGVASFGPFPELVAISDRVVDRLGRLPAVTAEDLGDLPGLRGDDERASLARLLPTIPEFVASFEKENPAASREEVTAPCSPGEQVQSLPISIPAKVTLRKRLIDCVAIAIHPDALLVRGTDEIPEHQLVRVTLLHPPHPLEMWCLTRKVESRDDGWIHVELHPFALDRACQKRWVELAAQR